MRNAARGAHHARHGLRCRRRRAVAATRRVRCFDAAPPLRSISGPAACAVVQRAGCCGRGSRANAAHPLPAPRGCCGGAAGAASFARARPSRPPPPPPPVVRACAHGASTRPRVRFQGASQPRRRRRRHPRPASLRESTRPATIPPAGRAMESTADPQRNPAPRSPRTARAFSAATSTLPSGLARPTRAPTDTRTVLSLPLSVSASMASA
jgi:hypothetical protein